MLHLSQKGGFEGYTGEVLRHISANTKTAVVYNKNIIITASFYNQQ